MWLVSMGAVSDDLPFQLKSGSYVLGRSSKCDIVLRDSSITRRHARIVVRRDGTIEVTDLGSRNGVFVNDELVESAIVTQGDRIRLGTITCRIAARPQQPLQKAECECDEVPTLPCPPQNEQEENAQVRLTAKKQAIAELLAKGYRQDRIAEIRGISFHTAHNHIREMYVAFKVTNLAEFLAKYHALKAARREKGK